ncbi:MAG: AraC family transcriptional regulator [Bacteroidetes bacterium]|nr:AraC family transcriptional regulator [Fibrella sp.]
MPTKPLLLKVTEQTATSLDIRLEHRPYFDNPWHYHPELELTLVTQSTGIRFVGDSIEPFGPGDLVLLGANLPHYWRNDDLYYQENSHRSAEAIILRFRAAVWGNDFLAVPETQALTALFGRATQGILFGQPVADTIRPLLNQLHQTEGMTRMLCWLRVFTELTQTPDYRLLSQKAFGGNNPADDADRINRVLGYVQQHLSEPIRLDDVAAVANMNPAAFCRYFKQQTNKTFIETLNDLRIHYACRLLIDSADDVSRVCFGSGFRNVAHFNQVFKAKTGTSPVAFRKIRQRVQGS